MHSINDRRSSRPNRIWQASGLLLCLLALAVAGIPAGAGAQEESAEQQERFMDMMTKYLDFSVRYVKIAEHPHAVLHLAVESIVETYENRGEGAKAINHLRGLLADTREQTARNLLRMKIRDLLAQYGRHDEALEELDAMFRENNGS